MDDFINCLDCNKLIKNQIITKPCQKINKKYVSGGINHWLSAQCPLKCVYQSKLEKSKTQLKNTIKMCEQRKLEK